MVFWVEVFAERKHVMAAVVLYPCDPGSSHFARLVLRADGCPGSHGPGHDHESDDLRKSCWPVQGTQDRGLEDISSTGTFCRGHDLAQA